MLVTHGLALSRRSGGGSAVTIGNFDGVHRGHQAMLASLQRAAAPRGLTPCALTFEPHPRELFAPAQAPVRLTSLREKLELLAGYGMQRTHIEHFTRAFAALTPEAFVERVLVQTLAARWVMVGEDFRFGTRRAGDLALLKALGERHGFEVAPMETVVGEGMRVSSSAVRQALAGGDLARAARLLGRNYGISGRVVRGDQLGRQLGFPTANIQLKHNRPPLSGIFAVRLHDADQVREGVASLGVRPTVKAAGAAAVLEVHVLDFDGDLYGRHVRAEFLSKIRDEEKYADLETLKAAIARDCEAARKVHRELKTK